MFIFTSKLSLQLETSLSIKLLKQEISNKKRKLRTIRRNLTSMTNKLSGWFNSYVTLKLPFLTHLPPHLPPPSTIMHCHVCSREPSCVTSRPAQTLPTHPFSIKNEILGFKKDRSRSKELSFLFYMFIFLPTSSEGAIFQEHVPKTHSFNIWI